MVGVQLSIDLVLIITHYRLRTIKSAYGLGHFALSRPYLQYLLFFFEKVI